jgi:hypothetical protein
MVTLNVVPVLGLGIGGFASGWGIEENIILLRHLRENKSSNP